MSATFVCLVLTSHSMSRSCQSYYWSTRSSISVLMFRSSSENSRWLSFWTGNCYFSLFIAQLKFNQIWLLLILCYTRCVSLSDHMRCNVPLISWCLETRILDWRISCILDSVVVVLAFRFFFLCCAKCLVLLHCAWTT